MFKKAIKAQSKLRLAIFGPSGAGKTMTALRLGAGLASQMNNKIALLDTERGSAALYADRFDFDVADLSDVSIEGYVNGINEARGYDVLIIDSISHGWQQLLEEVDKIANAKYRGNTGFAWSEGTPKQRKLVDAILTFPGHVIVTMRSKTEWSVESNDQGKTKMVRVGLSPEQRKGVEYEFTLLMELNVDHTANIIKDRSGKFQDRLITKPDEEFGIELFNWLIDGINPELYSTIDDFIAIWKTETRESVIEKFCKKYKVEKVSDLSADQIKEIITNLKKTISDAKLEIQKKQEEKIKQERNKKYEVANNIISTYAKKQKVTVKDVIEMMNNSYDCESIEELNDVQLNEFIQLLTISMNAVNK